MSEDVVPTLFVFALGVLFGFIVGACIFLRDGKGLGLRDE